MQVCLTHRLSLCNAFGPETRPVVFFVAVGFKQEPRAMSSCGLLAIQDPVGMANSIGRNIVCKYNIFCLFVYIWLLSLRIRNS